MALALELSRPFIPTRETKAASPIGLEGLSPKTNTLFVQYRIQREQAHTPRLESLLSAHHTADLTAKAIVGALQSTEFKNTSVIDKKTGAVTEEREPDLAVTPSTLLCALAEYASAPENQRILKIPDFALRKAAQEIYDEAVPMRLRGTEAKQPGIWHRLKQLIHPIRSEVDDCIALHAHVVQHTPNTPVDDLITQAQRVADQNDYTRLKQLHVPGPTPATEASASA